MTTEAQEHYINALISEYASVEDDKIFYNDFMEKLGEASLDTLSTKEASALIQGLIGIKVPLEMQCGKIMMVEKDEIMRGQTMGRLDECMHNCEIDFNECEYLKNQE
ncbi:hypothetical protein [Methanococcoides alaskense]|uniref:Uncharacterized protein n=1 Tax=Methanococcoides alaskense TaxID=325778 RepID=A0AA90TXQ4_9EURY|nr:hypothetical protein [Methanococcoides alaskense]MDA0525152.1 hypothetical protein [Methanococcoides alaskense]MDR6221927.1 hypothetical protein [Methanococcoides alaskense]